MAPPHDSNSSWTSASETQAPQQQRQQQELFSTSAEAIMDNITVEMKPIRLAYPLTLKDERERKEWIWLHYKDTLLDAMMISLERDASDLEQQSPSTSQSSSSSLECPDTEQAAETEAEGAAASLHYAEEESDEERYNRKRFELLDKVAHVQRNFLQSEGPKVVYTCLLNGILELMQSEFGFIGEVKYEQDNPQDKERMYLQTHATTAVGWDQETVAYFSNHPGVTFHNMDTLMGKVLTSKKAIICNDQEELRNLPLPRGHPGITSFLGIPLFDRGGGIIGNICIANKRGGRKGSFFTEDDIEFLKPFTVTGSNLIEAYWQVEKNNVLINTLERKVMERTIKLEEANGNLAEANRRVLQSSLAQLQHFACMSHEIRTPLNCIIGLSSLLLETSLTPHQEEALSMIVNSGDLLLTVVNDVLDYSKLESGNVEIEMRLSSLQETLNSTVHSIETKAQSKNIEICTLYDVTVPEHIETDSRRLQQILYNLLGNAIKFCEPSSTVELHVSTVEVTKEKILHSVREQNLNSSSSTTYIRFVVKDYGKGIEKKDFEQIFKPFRQASAETERVYGGTGLGLAITAKLVNALGGFISVDSEPGKWTEFTVDLPMSQKIVDVDELSVRLQQVNLYIVEQQQGDSEDKDQQESLSHRRLDQILDRFGARYWRFQSMKDLLKHVQRHSPHKHSSLRSVCLIQEDLFNPDSFQRITKQIRTVLATFGPKYSVETTSLHYRSLLKVLPSVLIQSLTAICSESIPSRALGRTMSSNRKSLHCMVNAVLIRDLCVLIAEDNLVNQKVLVRMLNRLGAENVDIVDNGEKAVQAVADKRYDLILMDLQMPVMDGIEACRRVLRRKEYSEGHLRPPKVVFVTAHVADSFEDACRQVGGSGFLPKPYNLNDIAKCFQSLDIEMR